MSNYLTSKQLKELQKAHRVERDVRYSDRVRALLYLSMGMDHEEVSSMLFCDERTVRRYEELYFTGGLELLLSDRRGGKEAKISDVNAVDLIEELRKKVYRTSKEIKFFIQKKYDIEYSLSAVHALLCRLGFVYKKPKVVPAKGDTKEQIKFANKVEEILENLGDFDKMYYVDGVHPQYSTEVTYG
jgi:transposase